MANFKSISDSSISESWTGEVMLNIEEIRARLEKASPGPWRSGEMPILQDHDCCSVERLEDVEFVSHARQDIPALLDEVERLRALVARYQNTANDQMDGDER